MTFNGLSTSTYCRLVRNCRNASARTERAWLSRISGESLAVSSNAIVPRTTDLGGGAQALHRPECLVQDLPEQRHADAEGQADDQRQIPW